MDGTAWLTVIGIFLLRATDVSIGTMRVMFVVRGQRFKAAALALVESAIFIFAISNVFKDTNQAKMLAYAAGFATGTLCGITIEGWIGSGFLLFRVISRDKGPLLGQLLRDRGFGVTTVKGEGREGEISILFVVAARKRGQEIIAMIRREDEDAFITIDAVQTPIGGHVPHVAEVTSVRK